MSIIDVIININDNIHQIFIILYMSIVWITSILSFSACGLFDPHDIFHLTAGHEMSGSIIEYLVDPTFLPC
jgi:hypothetical protein